MFARPVALALFFIFATSNAEAKNLTIAAWSSVFLPQSDQQVDERSLRVGFKEPGDKAPEDRCAAAVDIKVKKKKLSRGYRWMKHSAEYKALAEKTYMRAAQRLRELVAQRSSGAKPWVVVIDADETILNNLGLARTLQLKGVEWDQQEWDRWLENACAELVPGAASFLKTVIEELGGKAVIITNRPGKFDRHTRVNLQKEGVLYEPDKLCLLGKTDDDRQKNNQTEWAQFSYKNDKDRRRRLVSSGEAERCWAEQSNEPAAKAAWAIEHEIIMAIGDNIQDLGSFTQGDLQKDPTPLMKDLGDKAFLIPNALDGSWR